MGWLGRFSLNGDLYVRKYMDDVCDSVEGAALG